MTKDQFILYIRQPELLDENTIQGLKEIISDYPFFAAARMLYLRNLLNINSYKFETELVKHAMFIPDRSKLFKLLKTDQHSENEFKLIPFDKDVFKHFFDDNPQHDLNSLTYHESIPFQLIEDENTVLIDEANATSDLIDKFINENPTITPAKLVKPQPEVEKNTSDESIDEDLITDTLAGIYVRQGLYEEALSAYEKLILKFPEKNTYFANQIEKIKNLKSKKL